MNHYASQTNNKNFGLRSNELYAFLGKILVMPYIRYSHLYCSNNEEIRKKLMANSISANRYISHIHFRHSSELDKKQEKMQENFLTAADPEEYQTNDEKWFL